MPISCDVYAWLADVFSACQASSFCMLGTEPLRRCRLCSAGDAFDLVENAARDDSANVVRIIIAALQFAMRIALV